MKRRNVKRFLSREVWRWIACRLNEMVWCRGVGCRPSSHARRGLKEHTATIVAPLRRKWESDVGQIFICRIVKTVIRGQSERRNLLVGTARLRNCFFRGWEGPWRIRETPKGAATVAKQQVIGKRVSLCLSWLPLMITDHDYDDNHWWLSW